MHLPEMVAMTADRRPIRLRAEFLTGSRATGERAGCREVLAMLSSARLDCSFRPPFVRRDGSDPFAVLGAYFTSPSRCDGPRPAPRSCCADGECGAEATPETIGIVG